MEYMVYRWYIMMIRHMNHQHPVVQTVIAAQAVLRSARNTLQVEAWRMGKRAPQYMLRALDTLQHAQEHLSEEIRSREDCWIPTEVSAA
jgi:hypothetical protein